MDDISEFPPMQATTTTKYGYILNQGIHLKQVDGHMSIGLIRETFGHYYRLVKKIYLMSSTEALIDYVNPKKDRVEEKFFNLLTRVIQMTVNGVETPLLVTCSPIIKAPPTIVHDFVFMLCEGLSPLGLVMACDIIGNLQFQPPKK